MGPLRQVAHSLLEGGLDLLFPPCCAGCGCRLDTGILCQGCAPSIERIRSPRCPRCGVSFSGAGLDHLCHRCRTEPPSFDSTQAAYIYAGPLADGIRAVKYGPRPERIEPLAKLWRAARPPLPEVDLATPVPLHPNKLRRRGFNQTVALARPMLKGAGIPLVHGLLRRVVQGDNQASLEGVKRRQAPRGKYALTRRGRRRVADQRLLLVDDVMTTGATVNECARLLRAAGAREVHVAVLGRTVMGL